MRRRLLSAVVSFVMICLSLSGLCSCEKDREYNEAEVLAATADLIEKSLPLNEMFYGKGIAYTVSLDSIIGVSMYQLLSNDRTGKDGMVKV